MANYVTTLLTGPVGMFDAISRPLTVSEMLMHEKIQYLMKRRAIDEGAIQDYVEEPTPSRLVDFNELIPEPEHTVPAGSQLTRALIQNTWRMKHWGAGNTTQNLTITDFGPTTTTEQFSFETPYLHPQPMIEALSKLFPQRSIVVFYAEEDLCDNIGEYLITNGHREPTRRSVDDMKEFAAQLIYGKSLDDITYEDHSSE